MSAVQPCYLSTGDTAGYPSRLADDAEDSQLELGAELVDHALEVLTDSVAGPEELRLLTTDLTEALRDTLRVATSRGHRLPRSVHPEGLPEHLG
ncbi:hypothetical protein AB0M92_09245 [Streptomyces sp. NPDC051582]|uniref:hypothetical protein n=1 Tax=Streptomyces sp. NPDC051582 TaxID=3155167 RepID=UPI0034149A6D